MKTLYDNEIRVYLSMINMVEVDPDGSMDYKTTVEFRQPGLFELYVDVRVITELVKRGVTSLDSGHIMRDPDQFASYLDITDFVWFDEDGEEVEFTPAQNLYIINELKDKITVK